LLAGCAADGRVAAGCGRSLVFGFCAFVSCCGPVTGAAYKALWQYSKSIEFGF